MSARTLKRRLLNYLRGPLHGLPFLAEAKVATLVIHDADAFVRMCKFLDTYYPSLCLGLPKGEAGYRLLNGGELRLILRPIDRLANTAHYSVRTATGAFGGSLVNLLHFFLANRA